jgi:Xaa-Pro dipeptidase
MTGMLTNRARASRLMGESGVEAIIACSPANVRYLTGYFCWLAPLFKEFMVKPGGSSALALRNMALLPRDGEPCLVVGTDWVLDAHEGWVDDVRLAGATGSAPPTHPPVLPSDLAAVAAALSEPTSGATGPLAVLAGALADRGLSRARVGYEKDAFSAEEQQELARVLPHAELVDCSNLFRLVRAVKTAGEIDGLARAAEITERAGQQVFAAAREGASVSQLSQQFRAIIATDGADFDHFAVSLRGLGMLSESGRTLAGERALYVDFGCVHRGWFSDTGTTLSIGEPTPATVDAFAAVRDAVRAGANAMAPGVRGSAVQETMQLALAERGIVVSFPHGHGVGVEVRDYPILMPDSGARIRDDCVDVAADLPLEEGMVVNLEAPVFIRGESSVHCEQTFVITADGCRALVPQDRGAPIAIGTETGMP